MAKNMENRVAVTPEKQASPSLLGRVRELGNALRVSRAIKRSVEVALPVGVIFAGGATLNGCIFPSDFGEIPDVVDATGDADVKNDTDQADESDDVKIDAEVNPDVADEELEIVNDLVEVEFVDAETTEDVDAIETTDVVDEDVDACVDIVCKVPNATGSCEAGACLYECDLGFENCDGSLASNGCESEVATDIDNCGVCGTQCGGSELCLAGVCTPCDGYYPNGVCDAGENYVNAPQDCAFNTSDQGCFDGICAGGTVEDEANCPVDCPTTCGDGKCGAGETVANCSNDCSVDPDPAYCGDGICAMMGSKIEDAIRCPDDCDFPGDGLCGPTGNCETDPVDCGACAPSAQEVCGQ